MNEKMKTSLKCQGIKLFKRNQLAHYDNNKIAFIAKLKGNNNIHVQL